MQEQNLERIALKPWFDIEKVMSLAGETRMGNTLMEDLAKHWDAWTNKIKAINFLAGDKQYLVIWLNQDVEEYVDKVWADSASEGYLYNLLASEMIMSSVAELIPEVARGGCAPAPIITDEIVSFLKKEGLTFLEDEQNLARRYATLTYFPYKAGCEICTLLENCPKGQAGKDSLQSFELQGHEFKASEIEQKLN